MQKNQKTNVASLTALFLLESVAAFGQGGEKAKVEGMIAAATCCSLAAEKSVIHAAGLSGNMPIQ
jgi:hypothetical protein